MNDFEFACPTKILFGKGAENRAGREIKPYASRALAVCSRGRTNISGVVDRTLRSLDDAGVAYVELSGVRPDPQVDKVYEGIALVRQHGLGFVLAIGGGSAIDTAKAIAAGARYDGDAWDLFNGRPVEDALPIGAVLTLPASGSEMSDSCVLSKGTKKLAFTSGRVRPVFAAENPEVTLHLDNWQTFCGVADMMMHVLERYISRTKDTLLTDGFCEALLRCEIECGRRLLRDPKDYAARAEIMLASSFSHNDLAGMGRDQEWVVHGIGKSMGGLYGHTHGATISALACSWMRYILDDATERLEQLAVRVMGVPARADRRQTAMEGIALLEGFLEEMGLPVTLKALGVPTDDATLETIAQDYVENGVRGKIRRIGREEALDILRLAR